MPAPTPAEPQPPPTPPRDLKTRVLRNTGGVLLLLLGVVGLVLPFLQGVLFIVGGLALIDLPIKHRAHRWLLRFRLYQRVSRMHDAVLDRWRDWLARRSAPKEPPTAR